MNNNSCLQVSIKPSNPCIIPRSENAVFENNIAQYLKELTDTTKFSEEQIMVNLKDCLKDKKCCLFSCGANLHEHKDKFEQIKNDKTFITCCIKSAIEYLHFESDILALYGYVNGSYLCNDKIKDIFILKHENFEYSGASYNLSNFKKHGSFLYNVSSLIFFLNYIGIKEIYLFGFYLSDYLINDLTNYNYNDDLLCKSFHSYENNITSINVNMRTKLDGVFIEHIESSRIADFCIDNNISIYNVSQEGCLSNKIKRINFESLFLNKKTFNFSKIAYKDFLDEFDDKVDIDFYYERNCKDNNDITNISITEKKQIVFEDLIWNIHFLKKVNKHDTKKELILNDFITEILYLFSYISFFPSDKICVYNFFAQFLFHFNNLFNVCFYNDFDKICLSEFYDNLLVLYATDINDISDTYFDIFYSELNETKYNENKYFKLFIYLIHIRNKNTPNDFNPKDYKELNKDLQNMTDLEAKSHYDYDGYKENRKYKYENIPNDFNPKDYKELNKDLQNMTDLEAKSHYEYDGYKENRKYSK
jgi:hypothetical protein